MKEIFAVLTLLAGSVAGFPQGQVDGSIHHAGQPAGQSTTGILPIAGLIDVAFNGSAVTGKTGFAAVGVTSTDFWNTLDVDASLSLTNLGYVDGTASGVRLALQSASGTGQNGASDPMFGNFVYGYNFSVRIEDLAPGAYDVYLYGHGKESDENSVFQLQAGLQSYGSEATTNGPGWFSGGWQKGVQYVVFTNVNVSAGQIITVTVKPGTSPNFGVLSGMQIVKSGLLPFIVDQSTNQVVVAGESASFGILAGGLPPLSYQWLLNNIAIPDATNSGYIVTNVLSADAGDYSITVTNQYGAAISQVATLAISNILIFSPPADQLVLQATGATFSVVAIGSGRLAYQWLFNNSPVTGATNSSYTVTNVQPAADGDYSVVLTDSYGSLVSPAAMLTVTNISIITQPTNEQAYQCSRATFSVDAIGPGPLGYQWLFNSAAISGATNQSFSVASAQPADAGGYSVIVMNPYGSLVSRTAALSVTNISILAQPQGPGRVDGARSRQEYSSEFL